MDFLNHSVVYNCGSTVTKNTRGLVRPACHTRHNCWGKIYVALGWDEDFKYRPCSHQTLSCQMAAVIPQNITAIWQKCTHWGSFPRLHAGRNLGWSHTRVDSSSRWYILCRFHFCRCTETRKGHCRHYHPASALSGLQCSYIRSLMKYDIEIYLHLLWFLKDEMVGVVEILPHTKERPVHPAFAIPCQLVPWYCKEPGYLQPWPQKRKIRQVDSFDIHWRRWSLPSTSSVNIRAVTLTTFSLQWHWSRSLN